jgi:hypothetical protein
VRLGWSSSESLEGLLALSGAPLRAALSNAFLARFDRERERASSAIFANGKPTTSLTPVGILPNGDETLVYPASHHVLFEGDTHVVGFVS